MSKSKYIDYAFCLQFISPTSLFKVSTYGTGSNYQSNQTSKSYMKTEEIKAFSQSNKLNILVIPWEERGVSTLSRLYFYVYFRVLLPHYNFHFFSAQDHVQ